MSKSLVIIPVVMLLGCATLPGAESNGTPSQLAEVELVPDIVPQGDIRSVILVEGNCASFRLAVTTDPEDLQRRMQSGEALLYDIDYVAQAWCRDAEPGPNQRVGTPITRRKREGVPASEVVSELETFVQETLDAADPMLTGKEIIVRAAGDLLIQLKQSIRKAYGLMDETSATRIHQFNREAANDVELFEKAGVRFRRLAREIEEDVYELELFVPEP